MSHLASLVLVMFAVAGPGAASAPPPGADGPDPVVVRQSAIPDTGPRQLGPAAQLRKDVQLAPADLPGFDASKIPAGQRLPFNCVVYRPKATSENASPPVEIWVVYKGDQPVKVDQLFVHLVVPQLDGWNFTVSTKNYMLYPNWAWVYEPGSRLPANYNLPPEGQPLLRCDAFGWVKK